MANIIHQKQKEVTHLVMKDSLNKETVLVTDYYIIEIPTPDNWNQQKVFEIIVVNPTLWDMPVPNRKNHESWLLPNKSGTLEEAVSFAEEDFTKGVEHMKAKLATER